MTRQPRRHARNRRGRAPVEAAPDAGGGARVARTHGGRSKLPYASQHPRVPPTRFVAFDIYGLRVAVGGDWPEVIEDLRRDFAWFETDANGRADVEISMQRRAPDFDAFGPLRASFGRGPRSGASVRPQPCRTTPAT